MRGDDVGAPVWLVPELLPVFEPVCVPSALSPEVDPLPEESPALELQPAIPVTARQIAVCTNWRRSNDIGWFLFGSAD